MTFPGFLIEIVRQGWLEPGDASEYDAAAMDLCSHGDVRVVIGGVTIAPGDGDGEYGISEAALGLLRTMESDWPARPEGWTGPLIPHGCGAILMMNCPIGIDWSVTHTDGSVRLADVVRYDTTSAADRVEFPGLAVDIPEEEYRRQVIRFARAAKEPFRGVEKVMADSFDQAQYQAFWQEFDRLLGPATH
jgi:hypothetical protein